MRQFTKFELVINARTAATLGITIQVAGRARGPGGGVTALKPFRFGVNVWARGPGASR